MKPAVLEAVIEKEHAYIMLLMQNLNITHAILPDTKPDIGELTREQRDFISHDIIGYRRGTVEDKTAFF